MHVRILPCTLIFALALVTLGAGAYAADRTTPVPEPAATVGFDTQTFGSNVTIGHNWHKFNFYGVNPSSVNVTQNADGSVTINPGGDDYGAQLSTASVGTTGRNFSGIAFGGGGYFQATMSGTGPMSFWANDIETMNGVSIGTGAAPQNSWIEADIAEFDSPGAYGFTLHNWYGAVGSGNVVNANENGASPPGANYTQPNLYGMLWVPATATTQGYVKFYFNGQQVGNTITWNKYIPGPGPPSLSNGTAFSVLDQLHLALILGAGSSTSTTVYNVEVWQASAVNDISTLLTHTPVPTRHPNRPR
jgi:hypothetical protein